MPATERVVVLVSSGEKAAIERKAAAIRISTGDFMRRAASAYEIGTEAEAAELAALLPVVQASHAETIRCLDRAERSVDEALALIQTSRRR